MTTTGSGYFSNHSSQSRFLAISSNSTSGEPATAAAGSSSPAAQGGTGAPQTQRTGAAAPQAQRTRSMSKHFSTTVSVPGEQHKSEDGDGGEGGEMGIPRSVHPLRNTWVFWFRQQRAPGNKIVSYEEGIKRVAAFSSIESFWALHTHLTPPSALLPTTDYLLFHAGVARPVWEDPLNIGGGKWIIRLRKGVADRVWESLLCAVVGEGFAGVRDSATDTQESWEDDESDIPEICGCTISVRQSEDIIALWNRVDRDVRVRERIRDTLRTLLGLPAATVMEYKSNNDSMADMSSFRNSAIDRTPVAVA
ncbi:translation initiation factor eIF 4e-like domain-containing protein [Mycena crocata]|nr:translation initiation factor eIF 4e-like domain-containing protein [Mycena crocata]